MAKIEPFEGQVEAVIGDYRAFFADLRQRVAVAGIDMAGLPLTHLLYRVETMAEYELARDKLRPLCERFVETDFNGRPVSVMVLRQALKLDGAHDVAMIELPAPRPAHTYPTGLESIGVLVGADLPGFKRRYKAELTGVKEHGAFCQPAFITFDNDKTVKFYDPGMDELILLEGWRFEYPGLPDDAPENQLARMVNAWRRYLYGAPTWSEMIKEAEPKATGCGPVYELPNPIERPGESFAIADMREAHHTDAHYHHVMMEIYMVLEGAGTVVVGGQEITVQKDVTIVIPPDTAHFTITRGLVLAAINTPPFYVEDYLVVEESDPAVKFDHSQYNRLTKEA